MDDQREASERDGYMVLRSAVSAQAIADYAAELDRVRDGLLVRARGDEQVSLAVNAAPERPTGAIDPYALSPAARALLLPAPLTALLTARFDGDVPLLFDAAEAAAGAPDPAGGPFRDTTFVALAAEPETLVTVAVALGEPATVTVFPGSQRIATSPFSGRYRHFNPERDGDAALRRHRDELAAGLRDIASVNLTLAPGDVLVCSADLVRGPVEGAALIAHVCPARVAPAWFAYRPERARRASFEDGTAWIASQHYDLLDTVAPEQAPAGTEDERHLERVEEALRVHDEENAPEAEPPGSPPPPGASGPPRRSGGLVDSVRGLMSRRARGR